MKSKKNCIEISPKEINNYRNAGGNLAKKLTL